MSALNYAEYLARTLAPFVPTPQVVARKAIAMLDVENVSAGTAFCDLGCGDGRVALEAARVSPAVQAVGVECEQQTLDRAQQYVHEVCGGMFPPNLELRRGDLRNMDLRFATLFYAYLSQSGVQVAASALDRTKFAPGTELRFVTCEYPIDDPLWQVREVVKERCDVMGLELRLYRWRSAQSNFIRV